MADNLFLLKNEFMETFSETPSSILSTINFSQNVEMQYF